MEVRGQIALPVSAHAGLAVAVMDIGDITIHMVIIAFYIVERKLKDINLRRPSLRQSPEIRPGAASAGHFAPDFGITVLEAEFVVAGGNSAGGK